MTVAVGFRCVDGVVLAADQQYSEGAAKLYGYKIYLIRNEGHYALTIAGSGGVPSIKGAVREIRKSLAREVGETNTDADTVGDLVERTLRAYYATHIDCAPPKAREDLDFQLLIAVWTAGHGSRLFQTWRSQWYEVESPFHRCIGAGAYLTDCLTEMLAPTSLMSVEAAKPLAAFIVGRAKKFVQYCGGQTFVRALLGDGTDDRVWQDEIIDSNLYFEGFFRTVGGMRDLLGTAHSPENVDTGSVAARLKEQFVTFQKARLEDRRKQVEMRERARSRRLPR
jgi:20S proteasome alpha/beta subunit